MEKLMHYSRSGYNGNYTYTSVCGKQVKTHQDNEGSTIHPNETNCPDCKKAKEYLNDLASQISTPDGWKRRIYIESDILQSDEFRGAQSSVYHLLKGKGEKMVDRVFSDVLDFAWHKLEDTWNAVKQADEVWTTSSLMPLCGGSYMGAPVIFNGMCERAIKENITGKKVFVLNELKNIYWGMIDIKLMKQAFKNNQLYMYDEDYSEMKLIDVSKIKK